jgi:hypothetical protein
MGNRIKVIIERGEDGLFSAYCPDYKYLGKYSFGGFGDTVQQAQEDFLESVSEIKDICNEAGEDTSLIEYLAFEWVSNVDSSN